MRQVYLGTPSAAVTLTVTDDTPTLSLKVNPVTETYGKPVTVTGTLTDAVGCAQPASRSGSTPTNSPTGPLATGTTTANGAFSITLPEQAAGGTLYVGSASANPTCPRCRFR